MVRILGLLMVGLIALNIGFGVALYQTRSDAREEILLLRDEIQARTTFGPRGGGSEGGRGADREGGREGDRGGDRAGDRAGDRGGNALSEVSKRLKLDEEQLRAFKAFLHARRDMRRMMMQELSTNQSAFEEAMTKEPFDKVKLKALRDALEEKRLRANLATFLKFEAFLDTLDVEQRKRMFELGKGSPNSLLML